MKNKFTSLLLSLTFTILLLFILFINISVEEIKSVFLGLPVKITLLAFVFHFLAYIFRARAICLFAESHSVGFMRIMTAHCIHNFYVHVVPASLGELSFPFLLKKKLNMKNSLSILILTKLMIFSITFLLFIVSYICLFHHKMAFSLNLGIYMCMVGIPTGLIVIMILEKRGRIPRTNVQWINIFSDKMTNLLLTLREEFQKLRNFRFTFTLICLSCFTILSVLMFYDTILKNYDIYLNFYQIVFLSSINVGVMILPIKTIGGFGTTEGAWTVGLLLLGVNKELAISTGFLVHLLILLNALILLIAGTFISKCLND